MTQKDKLDFDLDFLGKGKKNAEDKITPESKMHQKYKPKKERAGSISSSFADGLTNLIGALGTIGSWIAVLLIIAAIRYGFSSLFGSQSADPEVAQYKSCTTDLGTIRDDLDSLEDEMNSSEYTDTSYYNSLVPDQNAKANEYNDKLHDCESLEKSLDSKGLIKE